MLSCPVVGRTTGQVPYALIQPADGPRSTPTAQAFLRERLRTIKVPRAIEFVDRPARREARFRRSAVRTKSLRDNGFRTSVRRSCSAAAPAGGGTPSCAAPADTGSPPGHSRRRPSRTRNTRVSTRMTTMSPLNTNRRRRGTPSPAPPDARRTSRRTTCPGHHRRAAQGAVRVPGRSSTSGANSTPPPSAPTRCGPRTGRAWPGYQVLRRASGDAAIR